MDGLKRVIRDEPVLCQALVQMAIGVGTAFGLNWTGEQVGAVMAFTAALLAFAARMFVTPTARFDNAVNTEAANIATAIVGDDRPLTEEEIAMLDRQIDRLNADFSLERQKRRNG